MQRLLKQLCRFIKLVSEASKVETNLYIINSKNYNR